MEKGSFLSVLKRTITRSLKMTHISANTKRIILNISGLAFSITSLVFVILSAIFYSTSQNLSFDFFAFALALLFIVLFIIVPEDLTYDP